MMNKYADNYGAISVVTGQGVSLVMQGEGGGYKCAGGACHVLGSAA